MTWSLPKTKYPVLIFHVDVNSAFLSWSALKQLKEEPGSVDLRTIPSAVAGDVETRHGIITAKSIPAKKYGIRTAEPVASALRKCPGLVLVKSDFKTYKMYSGKLMEILRSYSPEVEKVSIDEAYLEMSHIWDTSPSNPSSGEETDGAESVLHFPILMAQRIRDEVRESLGFTVNVGISVNRLLAKTASDFTKPDKTHTLWPEEIPEKLWSLPIGELHGCGQATSRRLQQIGILTVGDAARTDPEVLKSLLGERTGEYILRSSKGISSSHVCGERGDAKSYSNETTTASDITAGDFETRAVPILRRLSGSISARLKRDGVYGQAVTVTAKTDHFRRRTRQMTLSSSTADEEEIFLAARTLAEELLFGEGGPFRIGENVRLLGVGVSKLDRGEYRQMNLFEYLKEVRGDEQGGQSENHKMSPDHSDGMEKECAGTSSGLLDKHAGISSGMETKRADISTERGRVREEKLDRMLEIIRKKYGENAVRRGSDAPPPDP